MLEGVLKKLHREANRDLDENFQDISTAGTFIDNMSLAAMANEVGMGDVYNSTMGPASSALHGDWSALDDLYLDRCVHPLHASHVLPRLEPYAVVPPAGSRRADSIQRRSGSPRNPSLVR